VKVRRRTDLDGVKVELQEIVVEDMRPSRGAQLRGFHWRSLIVRGCAVLLVICLLAPFVLHSCSTYRIPPKSFSVGPAPQPACPHLFPPVSLDNNSFCTGACKSDCFPRVRNICFSAQKVGLSSLCSSPLFIHFITLCRFSLAGSVCVSPALSLPVIPIENLSLDE
jgi:hypothetical protein